MKKLIAVVITAAIVAATLVGVMGSAFAGEEKQTHEIKPFKIGMFGFVAADAARKPRYDNAIAFIEANGGEVINVEVENNDYISGAESMISAGVDGIIFPTSEESDLAAYINLCDAAGVYFICTDMDVPVEGDIAPLIENSEHYLGCLGKSEVQNGYDCASILAKNGVTKVGKIALPAALTISIDRDLGSQQAFDEYGVEVVTETRDFTQYLTTAGGANVAQTFMTAFEDLDGIFIGGATQYCLSGVVQAIKDSGRDVKVAGIDYDENIEQHMKDGIVVGFTGGNWNDDVMAAAILANAIQGDRLCEDPVNFKTKYFVVDSLEACEDFVNVWNNGDCYIYSEETLKSMMVANNPDFTFEDLMAINDAYSLESILANRE